MSSNKIINFASYNLRIKSERTQNQNASQLLERADWDSQNATSRRL